MASPFPGMNPYLEGPLWTSFHFTLGAEFLRQLEPKLPANYVALPVERYVLDSFDTIDTISISSLAVFPDVAVTREWPSVASPLTGEAIAEAPLHLATAMPEPIPHVSLEIRDVESRELVTAIEILSPTNKRGTGREEYVEKRNRILQSSAHLLEIDLLRGGMRVPMRDALPPAPYFVFLSRAGRRPDTEVWPIHLNQTLPTVSVPLWGDDPDVPLNLQQAVHDACQLMRCDRIIRYDRPLSPPLDPESDAWVQERLRKAGLL